MSALRIIIIIIIITTIITIIILRLRPRNTGLMSSRDSLISWGKGSSLALVGNPSRDGVSIGNPSRDGVEAP